MAAGAKQHRVRICLDLSEIVDSSSINRSPLCWISFENGILQSVRDFKVLIACRYDIRGEFNLYLANGVVPADEHVDILRDNDVIKVIPQSGFFKQVFDEINENLENSEEKKRLKREKKLKRNLEKLNQVEVPPVEKKRTKLAKIDSILEHLEHFNEPAFKISTNLPTHDQIRQKSLEQLEHFNDVKISQKLPKFSVITDEHPNLSPIAKNNFATDEQPSASEIIQKPISEQLEHSDVVKIRKNRTRKRKRKINDSFNESLTSPNSIFVPCNDVAPAPIREYVAPSGSGKHIRFDQENVTDKYTASPQIKQNGTRFQDGRPYDADVITNKSVIILNCESQDVEIPNKIAPQTTQLCSNSSVSQHFDSIAVDYSNMNDYAALHGPPRVNDVVAYKALELSSTYTPEVSDYKIGRVKMYEPKTEKFLIEILSPQKSKTNCNGKFELRYSDEEEDQDQTQLITQDVQNEIEIVWQDMIEPQLFQKTS